MRTWTQRAMLLESAVRCSGVRLGQRQRRRHSLNDNPDGAVQAASGDENYQGER